MISSKPSSRLLLVEENAADVDLVLAALAETASGAFGIEHVASLADAIQRLHRGSISVVLVDLSLPDSSGVQTFSELHTAAPSVPVVVLSGPAESDLAHQALRAGAQDCVLKGVSGEVLVRSLGYAIERKRAEQERARRVQAETDRTHLYALLDQAPALIAVTAGPDHVLEFANQMFLELSGRPEVMGKPLREVFPDLRGQKLFALFDRIYASGQIISGRERHLRWLRQGRRRRGFFTFTAKPILTSDDAVEGVIIHAVDVTDAVKARRATERAAAEREALLAQSAEGVIVASADGRITFMNDAAQRLYGVTASDVRVEDYAAVYHVFTPEGEPYPPNETPLVSAVRLGETVMDAEWVIHRPAGEEIFARGSAAPVCDSADVQISAVLVVRDDTASHQLNQQKAEFLAAASHDLKNPLTSIKATAQVLYRQASLGKLQSDRVTDGLLRIDRSVTQMIGLLDELLDVSRLQMDRPLELDRRPTDLVALVRQAATDYQHPSGHKILIQSSEEHLEGSWDAVRIERVLGNLITNAIKYSPARSEVSIRLWREITPGGETAVLAVQDHGIGIPASELTRVFERFHRASNAFGQARGTGVGLAIVKQVVELHGGDIDVQSEENVGSTFTVRLPLRSTADFAHP